MVMKAWWRGNIIADSEQTVEVENNHYFPPRTVNPDFLMGSDTHTTCPWKGEASYFHVRVGDEINRDAAWYYPDPKPAAQTLTGMIAFQHGVRVID